MLNVYNLFRRKLKPDLCCAVPQDYPVPTFVDGEAWEYGGQLHDTGAAPSGFRREAAQTATRLTGFYLFRITRG